MAFNSNSKNCTSNVFAAHNQRLRIFICDPPLKVTGIRDYSTPWATDKLIFTRRFILPQNFVCGEREAGVRKKRKDDSWAEIWKLNLYLFRAVNTTWAACQSQWQFLITIFALYCIYGSLLSDTMKLPLQMIIANLKIFPGN